MSALYPAFVSRFYDVIYENLRTGLDSQYYLEKMSEAKGPVLEIGVGTGRLFMEALKKGADVYGLDFDENMLSKLRSKIPEDQHDRTFLQDVRKMDVDKKFSLIVAPFRVFSHLSEPDDQLKALNGIHDHLEEDGRFIFDLFVPDLARLSEGMQEKVEFDGYYEPGKQLKRITTMHADNIRQCCLITMKYHWEEEGETKEGIWNFEMRYYFRYELEHLIARSKLTLETIWGGFKEQKLDSNSSDFVIVCKK